MGGGGGASRCEHASKGARAASVAQQQQPRALSERRSITGCCRLPACKPPFVLRHATKAEAPLLGSAWHGCRETGPFQKPLPPTQPHPPAHPCIPTHLVIIQEGLDLAAEGAHVILVQNNFPGQLARHLGGPPVPILGLRATTGGGRALSGVLNGACCIPLRSKAA